MIGDVINAGKRFIDLDDIYISLLLKIHEYDLKKYNKFAVVISSYDRLSEKYFGFKILDRSKPIEIHDPDNTNAKTIFYIYTDFAKKYKNEENRIERYSEFYHFFMELPNVVNGVGKFRVDFIPIKDEKELLEWQD